jgi:hypothetical protein
MQRLKTCAKRGEEIGLKAGSQPAGIRADGRVDNGAAGGSAAGDPSSGRMAGARTGSRSALWARLTATVWPAGGKPAPVVGNDGTETSPAVNSASEIAPARARRTEKIPNIGLAPELRHGSPSPQMRARPIHPRAKRTRPAVAGSVLFAQSPPCDPKNPPRRKSIRREQTCGSSVDIRTGHPSPLPPCLAGYLGRSRWTDRLRPNLLADRKQRSGVGTSGVRNQESRNGIGIRNAPDARRLKS